MTREEAVNAIEACLDNPDPLEAVVDGHKILCQLLRSLDCGDVVDIYEDLEEQCLK